MNPHHFDINYVANLARLTLTSEEEARLGAQLGSVLDYMDQLKTLDVSGVEATAHAFPMYNVVRRDEVSSSFSHDQALRNAPSSANGLFLVPKIVE